MNTKTLTYGARLVGLNFNPSELSTVTECKQLFATTIDHMNALRETTQSSEQKRLCSIAITQMQDAQMWAVKAYTWRD